MSTREVLLELAQKPPPAATLDDAMRELEFHQAIEHWPASKGSELVRA